MLVDAEGMLRWAAASDQQAEQLEQAQEALAQGPCTDAFWQRAPVELTGEAGQEIASALPGASFRAALSVPVELAGGPIGTLDAYARSERRWNESEVSALQACAGVVANLLGHAVAAWTQGRLARQLQAALEARVVIEQAKGALMEREGVDAAIAFERLRGVARSHHRTVVEVAREVVAGVPLPSRPAGGSTRPRNVWSSPTSRRRGCTSGSPRCMSCWVTPTGRGRSGSGPLGRGRGPSASGTARLDRRPHRGPDAWGAASRVQARAVPRNCAVFARSGRWAVPAGGAERETARLCMPHGSPFQPRTYRLRRGNSRASTAGCRRRVAL
jgi:ANTAR domain/GAF domain